MMKILEEEGADCQMALLMAESKLSNRTRALNYLSELSLLTIKPLVHFAKFFFSLGNHIFSMSMIPT